MNTIKSQLNPDTIAHMKTHPFSPINPPSGKFYLYLDCIITKVVPEKNIMQKLEGLLSQAFWKTSTDKEKEEKKPSLKTPIGTPFS